MPNYNSWRSNHYAEAVIGIAEFGWDAAARGASRELDMVPPCAAARSAARLTRRVVPVAAPLVHVLAHVEQAVAVRLAKANGLGTVAPAVGVDGGQLVAPRV